MRRTSAARFIAYGRERCMHMHMDMEMEMEMDMDIGIGRHGACHMHAHAKPHNTSQPNPREASRIADTRGVKDKKGRTGKRVHVV